MLSEHIAPTRLHIVVVAAPLAALTLPMIRPSRWLNRTAAKPRAGPKQQALLFAIGVWLGLIVLDGATYLLFALVLAVGRDLTEANAAKAALLTVSAAVSSPVLVADHSVAWGPRRCCPWARLPAVWAAPGLPSTQRQPSGSIA